MNKGTTYYLNGSKIRSLTTFGKELRNTFSFNEDLNLKNLNVVNDLLHGEFSVLLIGNEPYTIVWQNHKSSKRNSDPELYKSILEIFNGNPI